jgi:hypothetical protein
MMHRVLSLCAAFALLAAPAAAQSSEPVVETEPSIPTVNQSVTIYFNADQGTQGLEDYTGDIYAHTGIYTDQSPNTWKCVKNYWPTSPDHAGNRTDTRLTQVGPNRYKLEIDDIRAYYQDTSTECTLAADETVQTMNFVFRNGDGSKEGKADGGDDIIVELGDPNQEIFASIETPTSGFTNPLVIPPSAPTDTTISVLAVAQPESSLQEFTLSVDGQNEVTTSNDTLQYDLTLSSAGRKDVRVEATDDQGNTAVDSFYAVRAAPPQEEPVPSGLEDGINYTSSTSATLVLQAPNKEFVHVIGEFTDWEVQSSYQMKRETNQTAGGQDSTRYWIELTGLQSGKEYGFQYLVDGEIRIPDPYSGKVLSPNDSEISETTYPNLKPYPGDKTNQLVSVLQPGKQEYSFTATDYQRPAKEDLVIYELLVRDFIEKHNYQTLQDTLDYLDNLGVNAIELMPVSEFDNNKSWGYNPALYFATDKYYGPERELKKFIDMAHKRDIAVILDVVYNQGTGQSPFVRLFNDGTYGPPTDQNPWVNREARHPFNVFYDNNHESPFTQYWLDRANEYWLTEFNVDGFRFDLSKGFTQGPEPDGYKDVGNWSSYDQERIDILKRMARNMWSVDPNSFVILEHFAAPDEEKELATYQIDQGRPGMLLWNNMNDPYSVSAHGYDPGDNSDLSGTYYKNRGFSVPNLITYMESHDEQWLMHRNRNDGRAAPDGSYDISTLETALNRQKLVGAFFFTVPGPRMMWQFGELGYGWKPDECLKPGGGNDGECASSAPGRTQSKPIRWEYRDPQQSPNRVKLYKAWSALIQLRNQNEVFTSPDTDVSMQVGSDIYGRRITLQHSSMNAVVIGNFDVERRSVAANFPTTGTWYDYFSGASFDVQSDETDTPIELAPGEFHIFTSAPVGTPEDGIVPYDAAAPPPAVPANLQVSAGDGAFSVSWDESTSSDVTGYALYRGTTASFDTTGNQVARLASGTTSYTDSDVQAGMTYYYRVVALDADGARSDLSDADSGLLYPQTFSLDVTYSFGQGTRQQDYRLVAVPGDVSKTMPNTFPGSAGDEWQAYWDDGSSSDYLVEYDGSDTFRLEPGRGYWVISDTSWTISEEVSTVELNADREATIDVHQGWNIISNPFDRSLDWNIVQATNRISGQPLWSFDGTFSSQSSTFPSARTGQAFYFRNPEDDLDQLVLPYDAVLPKDGDARTQAAGEAVPTLTLRAEREDGASSTLQVGWSANASAELDAADWVAPPSRFSAVSLRSTRPDAIGERGRILARDVRASGTNGTRFDLRLTAAGEAPVFLRAENRSAWADRQVRLVNETTGEAYDLRSKEEVTVSPRGDTTPLTLLTGTKSYVERQEEKLTANALALQPGYPNPFREKTTLSYTVPEAGRVTLEVFDILGRRIRVLVNERKKKGTYEVTWNGGNGTGRTVASGVYLGRLTFKGKTKTQKMVVVR